MANKSFSRITGVLFCLLSALSFTVGAERFQAERLNGGEPILTAQHFRQLGAPPGEGNNINGPSVIRIPDWIPKEQRAAPQAQYYLYFAHHGGQYIRLAWAEAIEGPWQLYRTGAQVVPGQRGVLDMGDDRMIALGGAYTITGHIASPDVHVDEDSKQIVLYFHGPTKRNGKRLKEQKSYVASSPWGLDFSRGINPLPLSSGYLRVFEYRGILQGLSATGYHARARSGTSPWSGTAAMAQTGDVLWEIRDAKFLRFSESQVADGQVSGKRAPRVRHAGLYRLEDRLYAFFTMIGHSPERILVTGVDLNEGNWFDVAPATAPAEVLRAERTWEGAAAKPERSRKGAEYRVVNALRDPFVFSDRENLYLFYAGGGEQAIGVARLTRE